MQFARASSTAAMFLLFGAIVPANAQQEKREAKQAESGQRQEDRRQGATPPRQSQPARREQQRAEQPRQQQQTQNQQQRQQQVPQPSAAQRQERQQRQAQQARPAPQRAQQQREQRMQQPQQRAPRRAQEQAAAWQRQRGWLRQGAWQGGATWGQGRAQQWENEHRSWAQRGGYGGYFIPQSVFSISFGTQNFFRIHSRPTVYMGYPRFRYGGYSFLLLDPWPEYWQENWYDTDDVFVDYDEGYYLHNRNYPNVRLAISIVR